ncbi:histone-like nucleoid-structuring protein Lsr2 [Curtobacterium sp. 'Ferrero']|uniref:exonuclease domain-containing protein n=1 Tax=Curtobacterium sp. 'Ferrero' TaxID=2033654 RepID=UPI00295F483E|nr:histone-like nucleoid-structuring protein Lsr2 [Curtobacterium sp. 'Ferrero']
METTGLSPLRDRIIELAIVRIDESGVVVDEWVSRFNPDGPVGATHIHGITDADVAAEPRFADVASSIVAALSGLAVVAHNATFDLAFLRHELAAAGWRVPRIASYCTLDASYAYLPDMDRRRLVDCCCAVGVRLDDAHSALGDARAAAALLGAYLSVNGGPDPVLMEVTASARSAAWPSRPAGRPSTAQREPAGAANPVRPLRITPPKPPAPALLQQLTAMSLLEVIDEGAPAGTTAYVELLFDALEDGDITGTEAQALQELVAEFHLSAADTHSAHEAFLLALAHRALDDGRVSHQERRELKTVASLLGVAEAKVKQVLDRADAARDARLGAELLPLPAAWPHGEPLRVGDRVVFTGCDEAQRFRLEQRAQELGVRVAGSVSRLTAVLVTDGAFSGTKAAKAQQLGTRQVHPDTFALLLQHLQPAVSRSATVHDRKQIAPPPDSAASVAPPGPGAAGAAQLASSPAAIRAWASANGFDVGTRGRLPREVSDAFAAAHPGT